MKKIFDWKLGAVEALTITFVALKLSHKIDWSWWLVLVPIWFPTVCRILSAALVYTAAIVRAANLNRAEKEKDKHDKETGNRR